LRRGSYSHTMQKSIQIEGLEDSKKSRIHVSSKIKKKKKNHKITKKIKNHKNNYGKDKKISYTIFEVLYPSVQIGLSNRKQYED